MSNKTFLQNQAYNSIIHMIHSQEMKPDILYSETKLAKQLGFSRTPLREALQALAQDGYITVIPSRGFMIRQLSEQEFLDTIQIRCAIEGFCVQMITAETSSKRFHTLMNNMTECLEKMKKGMTAEDFPGSFIMYDHKFHQLMIDYISNKEMSQTYRRSMYMINLTSSATLSVPGRAKATYEEHASILQYLKNGDGDGAYRYLIAHLMLPMNMKMFSQPQNS